MAMTVRELNRATLARQLLLARKPLDIPTAVHRLVGLQSQQPASPYIALWNRISNLDPQAVDQWYASAHIIKATLFRRTLHTVHADDYGTFHAALQPTVRPWMEQQYTKQTPFGPPAVDDILSEVWSYTRTPRTNQEIEKLLGHQLGSTAAGVWRILRAIGQFRHVPTGGPWSFGQRPVYTAVSVPHPSEPMPADRALETLLVYYLRGFGPATVADLARFSSVSATSVRSALHEVRNLVHPVEGPEGTTLFDIENGPCPPADWPSPARLMPMWDNALLAYADRRRILPTQYRDHIIRVNGDVLPTILIDGFVAGVWRHTDTGIEVRAFRPLEESWWEDIARESRALSAFLGLRDAKSYGRCDRWWAKLPHEGEVRLIPTG